MSADPLSLTLRHMVFGRLLEKPKLRAQMSHDEAYTFIEDLVEDLCEIIFEADSFDVSWFGDDERALPPIAKELDSLPGPGFQRAGFLMELDSREKDAVAAARRKNPEPIADLIAERGHLRTQEARTYVAQHLKGLPQTDGRPKTTINSDTAYKIIAIKVEKEVSFEKAKEIFLERYPEEKVVDGVKEVDLGTLEKRILRAKKEDKTVRLFWRLLQEQPSKYEKLLQEFARDD